MKYVVYLDGDKEFMVIFPRAINHDRMKEALECLRFGDDRDWHRRQGEIVSAGFIDGNECGGRSESLDVDSRKGTDTMLYRAGGVAKVQS